MTDEQTKDAEAIAALDAFYAPSETHKGRPLLVKFMRKAIDAASAFRRAQPASGLADDARKIAEVLKVYSENYCEGWCGHGGNFDDCGGCNARAALPLAESLPGKIAALEGAAFPPDMFDPAKRAKESYKDLWEAATELAAEDHKEHCRLMREIESQLAERDAVTTGFQLGLEAIAGGDGDAQEIARQTLDNPLAVGAALSPPIAAKQDEPTDHEAAGAMLYRGHHEARTNNGGDDE
jgi:hypothetical protein